MPNRSTSLLRSSLAASFLSLLAACAATSTDEPAPGAATDGEVVNAEDALTSAEAAEGSAWHGEHDELTPEEESALATDHDEANDPGPAADDAVTPTSLRIMSGGSSSCAQTTGYNRGRAMRICATTVNGKQVEIETAKSFVRMRDAAAREGVSIVVVSGFRTMAKQRDLYALYKAGRGNLAAPPGYSNHQSGHALDLNTKARGVYAWLARNGAKYGFRRTVPSENWHWERW